jgi:L-ascorbate metabolism protein UlaG (beta-lactamase superfamily)
MTSHVNSAIFAALVTISAVANPSTSAAQAPAGGGQTPAAPAAGEGRGQGRGGAPATPPKTKFEEDTIKTSAGDLKITHVAHGSVMFTFGGKVIHVDPVLRTADYSTLPKADVILVSHTHGDHMDPAAVTLLTTPATTLLVCKACTTGLPAGTVMNNGDTKTLNGVKIDAVPAYNIVNKRPDGSVNHPKGDGNGYVLTFGTTRVYVAGDTENVPEMNALQNIDIAFLPVNGPTMTPEMFVDAVKAFRPKIVYPYHFSQTDTSQLAAALKSEAGIDVRLRDMR